MEMRTEVTEQFHLLPAQRFAACMERLHQITVGLQLQIVDVFLHRRLLIVQGLALAFDNTT